MARTKFPKRIVSLLCALALVVGFIPTAFADDGDAPGAQIGIPTIIWSSSTDPAVTGLDAGAFASAGPIVKNGDATLTARKDVDVKDSNGWVDWTVPVAIDVTRAAASDSIRFDPAVLGLVEGQRYIWEIEGQRPSGNQTFSFGTVADSLTGAQTAVGSAVTPIANNNPTRPGYFSMKVTVEHSSAIAAYSLWASTATGGVTVFNVTVKKENAGTLYYTDFSDGTPGIIGKGSADQDVYEARNSEGSTGGKVLYTEVGTPGYSGLDLNWHHFEDAGLVIPSGANIRATVSARIAPDSELIGSNSTWRIATRVGESVANWGAASQSKALTKEFQTYTASYQLATGTDVQAFQFCKDKELWMGAIEFDWLRIEILDAPVTSGAAQWESVGSIPSLKDAYAGYFTVGNVLDRVPTGSQEELFLSQYNSITPENCMKPGGMSSAKGVYNFENADALVDWANANDIQFNGHALLWHSQSAAWLTNEAGGAALTYAEARANLKEFISTVAGRYSGKLYAWDVVNEVFTNSGGTGAWHTRIRPASEHPWRAAYSNQAPAGVNYYDFVYDAFMFARQADPYAKLQYNDFNDDTANKARNIRDMTNDLNLKWAKDVENNPQASESFTTVQEYLDAGGRLLVEGVGLQSHYGTGTNINNIKTAFGIYAEMTGVVLSVTELDVGGGSGTSYNSTTQATMFENIFKLYIENANRFDRVTIWGLNDVQSWRSGDSPTLFGSPTARNNVFKAKPVFHIIAALPTTYPNIGISAAFSDDSQAVEIGMDQAGTFLINLAPTGGLAFTGSNPVASDLRVSGLPQGMSVTGFEIANDANANITISGTAAVPGEYKVYVEVKKTNVISGTNIANIAGDWVGTRVLKPLTITVTAPPVPISDPIKLTSAAHLVKKNDYFSVTASFAEEVKSNTVVLNYTFDKSKFAYRGFTAAEGTGEIGITQTEDGVKIILMIQDYNATSLGEVLFSTLEDLDLDKADNEIILAAEYVAINADEVKEIRYSSASVSFTSTDDKGTGENGVYTLIDLSNVIDMFGVTSDDPEWNTYRFYDFNNDGIIDILDITNIAQKI